MRHFTILLGLAGLLLPLTITSAGAVQLGDGTTAFNRPPQLTRSAVSPNRSGQRRATYHFTLTLPDTAGEDLGQVLIVPEPNVNRVRFQLTDTTAFVGDSFRGGPDLPVAIAETEEGLLATFEPALAPGQTVTLVLKGQNPLSEGTYLFGITAFPAAPEPRGQFLGYGRLEFYERHDNPRFRLSL